LICIFSISTDTSTAHVMKWLYYLGIKDVIRINADADDGNPRVKLSLHNNDFEFQHKGQWVALKDISVVWYRKGRRWLCNQYFDIAIPGAPELTQYLKTQVMAEEYRLSEYIHFLIEHSSTVLGTASRIDLNKMRVLFEAQKAGLKVPDFYLANTKEKIEEVVKDNPSCITKAISETLSFYDKDNNISYQSYTEPVTNDIIAALPDTFSPSFVQQYIDKKFELRVFYLDGDCYTMAIMSQSDEQTRVDFRKYNLNKPNRFVPYLLPTGVEKKLKRLFKHLNINTGSADLVVSHKDEYYFLEINPVGQFGMVSIPCNYGLEKAVALFLATYERSKTKNEGIL
jgi:ATP-GRASP peptide maturase of grasp-with-spasm system